MAHLKRLSKTRKYLQVLVSLFRLEAETLWLQVTSGAVIQNYFSFDTTCNFRAGAEKYQFV
jgi:hypothetical protein